MAHLDPSSLVSREEAEEAVGIAALLTDIVCADLTEAQWTVVKDTLAAGRRAIEEDAAAGKVPQEERDSARARSRFLAELLIKTFE